ncbi:MAG: hypothetical protein ACI8VW_000459 [bacterium]
MLVTFKTSAYSDITFFGDAAVSLLKLMGQSGNVPGALLAADIPEAMQTLHEGLKKMSEAESEADSGSSPVNSESSLSDSDSAPPVALHTRAGPLVSLLQAAADANESVLWDS